MAGKLSRVLEPGYIGSVRVKNRLVRMGAQGWEINVDFDGKNLSPRIVDYYEALAAGGSGLVTVAGGHIGLDEPSDPNVFTLGSDIHFSCIKHLADVIHKHDAVAFWQLMSPGPTIDMGQGEDVSLASSTLSKDDLEGLVNFYIPPTAVTIDQINQLVAKYADVAERLQRAGFDGVEVNSAHVHFLNTFVSKAWNRRTDEYGGDAEGRSRIVCDIVRAIKERCGKDFAIVNLISGAEYNIENATTVEDSIEVAKCLEKAGSDCIHVRYEFYHDEVPGVTIRTAHEVPDIDLAPGSFDEDLSAYGIDTSHGKGVAAWSGAAAQIKKNIAIPVMLVGRMDAFVAEKLIEQGKIDFANICRRNIADHDYVNKIIAGAYDDIRPCVGCYTCYDMAERGMTPWCMVNGAFLGGAEYAKLEPAEQKKKVVVVGSGASGLEAARVCALRGHDVTIIEKDGKLGGSLPLAAMIKGFKEDFLKFSQWQVRQVEKLGVKKMLGTVADKALIESLSPDAVIVAVGGAENTPDIPGIGGGKVLTGETLHEMLRFFNKFFSMEMLGKLSKIWLPIGKRVVLLGGGIHGVQTAEFLVRRGRKVIIVEESDEFGSGMIDCGPKPQLIAWLRDQGVEFHSGVRCKQIVKDGVIVVDAEGGEKLIAANNVLTTLPLFNNLALCEELKAVVPEVYAVGDCNPLVMEEPYPPLVSQPMETKSVWPQFTATAVREAYRVAKTI